MSEWLRAMGPAVGNHLWQSTAFVAMAWTVTLLLKRNQARVRYAVWLAASVKFLLPFSLLVGLGGMLPRPQHAVVAMPVYSAVDEVGMPFSAEDVAVVYPTHAAMKPRHEWGTLLPMVLAGVWGCGTVVVLAMWCGGWWKVRRTLRRARLADAGREAEILRQVQESMNWRWRRIRLVLSDEQMEPGMYGIFRPVLIWPEQLSERLDDEHIAAIVSHELMHARRRDNLTAALHMLVEAAFWFHPAVWWMERRMVEERERACDEAVVSMGSRPGVYAESLLRACRFCVESPLVCVAGITGADLAARVRSIMTLRLERLGWGRKIALGLLALAAVGAPILLGQAKAAQRMMLAVVKAAPTPFRLAARAMLPLEETPSSGLIAEAQVPSGAGAPLPQAQGDAKPFIFDVVSIRPAAPPANDGRPRRIGFQFTDDEFLTDGQSLVRMLMSEYRSQLQEGPNSIVGGPDWARTQGWDIRAKVADSDVAEWSKFSHDSSAQAIERRNATIQALLAERFKLKTHFESKEGTVYALVVAKGGPKLTASTSDARASVTFGPGRVSSPRMRLAGLAQLFTLDLGHPVIDKTGLAGDYAISVNWTPAQGGADSTGGDAGQASAPGDASASLFTAVQEQLGLKLEAQKGPIETLVIDSAEKPSVDGAEVPESADTSQGQPAVEPGTPGVGATAKFEVATIKLRAPIAAPPGEEVIHREEMVGPAPGPRLREIAPATDRPQWALDTRDLIASAYGLSPGSAQSQIVGGPNWLSSDVYEIYAKIDDATVAAMRAMTAARRMQQMRVMEQALLADRFGLKAHFETRELPEYALVLAKGGPKLTPAEEGETPRFTIIGRRQVMTTGANGEMTNFSDGGQGSEITERAVPMDLFARGLSPTLGGRVVVDQTGLTGTYDFTLKWGPDHAVEAGSQGAAEPPLFTAIQQQLGLKLVETKGPVQVLVIDSVERPSEN